MAKILYAPRMISCKVYANIYEAGYIVDVFTLDFKQEKTFYIQNEKWSKELTFNGHFDSRNSAWPVARLEQDTCFASEEEMTEDYRKCKELVKELNQKLYSGYVEDGLYNDYLVAFKKLIKEEQERADGLNNIDLSLTNSSDLY